MHHEQCGRRSHQPEWVGQLVSPSGNVELRAQDGGCSPVTRFHDFKQITAFAFFQRIQQPLVNDQQGVFLVLCHEFADRSVATGNAEFHQQIRQTDVFHRQELSCSCHAQCTGQIGLAAAGSPPAGSHCGAHGCSCRSRGGAVLPSSASCLADTPHSPDKLQGRRRLPAGSGAANGCSFVHSILRQQ